MHRFRLNRPKVPSCQWLGDEARKATFLALRFQQQEMFR